MLKTLKQQLSQVANDGRVNHLLADQSTRLNLTKLTDNVALSTSPEEKRMNKVMKRTTKEIVKLRQSSVPTAKPDVITFR